jgi:hypothetical protein
LDCNRLAQLLGMLGSDFDGEVINAGRLAVRLVKDAGLTWQQVVDHNVAIQAARQLLAENERLCANNKELQEEVRRLRARSIPIPSSWQEPQSTSEKVEQALEWTSVLTDWEREFATSIAGRWRLTGRQQDRLDQISLKIARIARARGIAA